MQKLLQILKEKNWRLSYKMRNYLQRKEMMKSIVTGKR